MQSKEMSIKIIGNNNKGSISNITGFFDKRSEYKLKPITSLSSYSLNGDLVEFYHKFMCLTNDGYIFSDDSGDSWTFAQIRDESGKVLYPIPNTLVAGRGNFACLIYKTEPLEINPVNIEASDIIAISSDGINWEIKTLPYEFHGLTYDTDSAEYIGFYSYEITTSQNRTVIYFSYELENWLKLNELNTSKSEYILNKFYKGLIYSTNGGHVYYVYEGQYYSNDISGLYGADKISYGKLTINGVLKWGYICHKNKGHSNEVNSKSLLFIVQDDFDKYINGESQTLNIELNIPSKYVENDGQTEYILDKVSTMFITPHNTCFIGDGDRGVLISVDSLTSSVRRFRGSNLINAPFAQFGYMGEGDYIVALNIFNHEISAYKSNIFAPPDNPQFQKINDIYSLTDDDTDNYKLSDISYNRYGYFLNNVYKGMLLSSASKEIVNIDGDYNYDGYIYIYGDNIQNLIIFFDKDNSIYPTEIEISGNKRESETYIRPISSTKYINNNSKFIYIDFGYPKYDELTIRFTKLNKSNAQLGIGSITTDINCVFDNSNGLKSVNISSGQNSIPYYGIISYGGDIQILDEDNIIYDLAELNLFPNIDIDLYIEGNKWYSFSANNEIKYAESDKLVSISLVDKIESYQNAKIEQSLYFENISGIDLFNNLKGLFGENIGIDDYVQNRLSNIYVSKCSIGIDSWWNIWTSFCVGIKGRMRKKQDGLLIGV